jgi:hypothetical protein
MSLPLPTVVIAGVGKAGTTSLFWYLSQHPDVCASDVKETRYFTALSEGGGELPPLEEYAAHFDRCAGERHRLEASPQYFHGGTPVATAMRDTLPDTKVIVLLRDPVDRLWSTFRFMRTRLADLPPDMTFESYVEACTAVRDRREPYTARNRLFWTIQGGFYDEYLDPWLDTFGDRFRIVFFEHMTADPPSTVRELSGWLGIDPEAAGSITYSVENKTVPVRSAALQRLALTVNREGLLGGHRRLKDPLRRAYYALNRKPEPERMAPETRRALDELFAPGNEALAQRLAGLGHRDLPGWLSAGAGDVGRLAR